MGSVLTARRYTRLTGAVALVHVEVALYLIVQMVTAEEATAAATATATARTTFLNINLGGLMIAHGHLQIITAVATATARTVRSPFECVGS